MKTIRELNLSKEELNEICMKLKYESIEELLNDEDFRVFDNEKQYLNWVYDEKYDSANLINFLSRLKVIDENKSLLENAILNIPNVFKINKGLLVILDC